MYSRWTPAAIAAMLLAAGLCSSCGSDSQSHIVKNEDGVDVDITGSWANAYAENGDTTGDLMYVSDITVSYSVWAGDPDMDRVSFSYSLIKSHQLTDGKWTNDFDLVVEETDLPMFTVGDAYYASVFVWNDNDHANLVLDDSLPYPTTGNEYPSVEMPMFRHFSR
ncbi:MAG: hypothetical protein JXR96_07650 [Deltaproteobacteria bacterium]|nr:hypothetical protein [Deltaproteobacteria bacterium]